jgi:hypothetical protein
VLGLDVSGWDALGLNELGLYISGFVNDVL